MATPLMIDRNPRVFTTPLVSRLSMNVGSLTLLLLLLLRVIIIHNQLIHETKLM